MPKLNEEQIYDGLVYRKAFLDLISQESFLSCFVNLRLLTREIIASAFSLTADSACTASFESCRDVYEYVSRLERSLGFSEAKWAANLSKLYQFFDAMLATGQFDVLRSAVREFKSELTELASGSQLLLPSIEINELNNDIPMYLTDHLYVDTPTSKPIQALTYSPAKSKEIFPSPKPWINDSNQLDLDRCYAINKGIRGVCCIINIYRNFSTYDVTDGQKVFENLSYKVVTFDNITAGTFVSSIKRIRSLIEELNSDSFVLIFSSHGDPENVMFADGRRMSRERIILEFLTPYCPCLAGKPKLFFFQNCRGDHTFEIANNTTQPDPNTDSLMQSDAISSECARISHNIKIGTHLPTDIMRFYASTEGSVAYRLSTGSIFLQSLYEILQDETINRESLNELQSDLVRRVTCYSQATLERSHKTGGQVPEFKSSLVKKFYFKHPHILASCSMCADYVDKLIQPIELVERLESVLGELEITADIQPLRQFLEIPQPHNGPSGYFVTMPAHVPPLKCFGVKILTLYPGNAGSEFPSHSSQVLLYESERGQLISQLEGDPITNHRTAAISAIAVRHLSTADKRILAIIGSSSQARSHIRYLTAVRDFEEIRVWSRNPENVKQCIYILQNTHNITTPLVACNSAQEACVDADVIVTVTLSKEAVVKGSWLREGALVVCVGACRPDWRELDDELMHNAAIYTDNVTSAVSESGDIILSGSKDRVAGDLCCIVREKGKRDWRGERKFILFKSLGMACEDVVAAQLICSKKKQVT